MKIRFIEKNSFGFYVVFRLLVGLMFAMHGFMKFGVFGGPASQLFSLFGIAGVIEIVVGLLVFFGYFVEIAAVFGAIEMLVAYFMVHAPNGWNPLANKGELALMYLAAFLVLAIYGSGKRSKD